MKVYCLIVGFWDHDLTGVYANEESAILAAKQYSDEVEWYVYDFEVEDLIDKETK